MDRVERGAESGAEHEAARKPGIDVASVLADAVRADSRLSGLMSRRNVETVQRIYDLAAEN